MPIIKESNLKTPTPVTNPSELESKQFLTNEEKQILKEIQSKNQEIMIELGEISMMKLQNEKRYEIAKNHLIEVNLQEQDFSTNIFKKYGKITIHPKTGEIIALA